MNLFITYLGKDPRVFFSVAVIVILSVCIHEFMHAYVALRYGDDTAEKNGHLTLNPFKQMGIFSLVLFCFFGLAWGRVPVNPSLMRGKYAPAMVAFSGPLSNLVLSQFFVLLTYICFKNHIGDDFAVNMLFYGGRINIVLFILNMLPVPGFDGYAILSNIFPAKLDRSSEAVKGTVFVLIMLLFVFFDRLFKLAHLAVSLELVGLEWLLK